MLNKERIRLMTKLAAYEQNEGKEDMPMGQYYRSDYVGLQMIKTFICSTIAFGIIMLLQVMYELEEWVESLYQMDYVEYATGILINYAIFVIAYQILAWCIYNLRYRKGYKRKRLYHKGLKKIQKLYEREETLNPVDE